MIQSCRWRISSQARFGHTFEYTNREKLGQREPASPLTLLEILAGNAVHSLRLFELQAQNGMEPSRYGEALKSLLNAGYITITGDAPEQLIIIT